MSAEEEVSVRPQPNFDFRLMSLAFKVRDFIRPRMNILKETGIKAGFHVLETTGVVLEAILYLLPTLWANLAESMLSTFIPSPSRRFRD